MSPNENVKKVPCGDECAAPTVCGTLLGGKCALKSLKQGDDKKAPKKPGNVTGKKK